jgi:pimeloyl-ACP methyl ester carboxylesterase
VKFVESTPHGRVVSGTGDHWIFHENPELVNGAMVEWLASVGL